MVKFFEELTDNDSGVVKRAISDLEDFERVLRKVLDSNFREEITQIINRYKWIKNNYEDNFLEIIKN